MIVKHVVGGKTACTVEDLAELTGKTVKHVQQILFREAEAGHPLPTLGHCGRKALYDPKVFQRALNARPGKGIRRAKPQTPTRGS